MSGNTVIVATVEPVASDRLAVFASQLPVGVDVRTEASVSDLADATYLFAEKGDVTADVIASAPNLRCIVAINSGGGSIDQAACESRGISLRIVRSVSLMSVAEHAVMSMLMLYKRFPEADRRLRSGAVVGNAQPALTTQESYAFDWVGLNEFHALRNQTIGLVGLGQIGMHAAKILNAFGCDVVYTKRNRLAVSDEVELGVRYLPFDELLSACSCVSLHNRFDDSTEKMMGLREFRLMPKGSFFVNTARGRLVDEGALLSELESGHLGGAALDVFWMEPLPSDSPLLNVPNLILTPHTGGIPMAQSEILEIKEAGRILASELRKVENL